VKPESIDEHFWLFHCANPWVYDEIVRLARGATALGHKRVGIGALWERMRWAGEYERPYDPHSTFKLNDHLRSRYARHVMDNEPDLAGVFELRRLRAA
jgi:hypothetical protein